MIMHCNSPPCYLEKGAVFLGSVNPEDYPVRMREQTVARAIPRPGDHSRVLGRKANSWHFNIHP